MCVHMCHATALHLWSHVQACTGQLWGDQLQGHLLCGGLQATPDGHGGQEFGTQHTAYAKGAVRWGYVVVQVLSHPILPIAMFVHVCVHVCVCVRVCE